MSHNYISRLARLAAWAVALTLLLTACAVPIPQDTFGRVNPLSTSERGALVALYDATGGAEWKNNAQWGSDQHISSWHGVQYYKQAREAGAAIGGVARWTVEHVDRLNLAGNGLTGEIPAKLHGLNDLRRLDLRGNRLTGEIPSELGRMDNLRELYLGGNQLTGEIPSKLGDMDGLYHLSLANNQLTGEIPPELSELGPRLRTLSLRGNQLTGEIPPELGKIRDLQVLDLRNNNLTGKIPSQLDNPRNINELYLGGNRLTGCIPDSFERVQYNDILLLNLPLCRGGALPGDITSRVLIALFNATGGYNWHDNTNWGSSRQTSSWYGVSNKASRNPRHVTMLQLPQNNLTGEIPPELGNLGSLTVVDLRGNNLTGEIPAELGKLHLPILLLSGNKFTGCIPPVLASVSNNDLPALDLPFCDEVNLSPREINPALLALYNSTNGDNWRNKTGWLTNDPIRKWFGLISGPSEDSDGTYLVSVIRLYSNNLTGEIPTELGNLEALRALNLSRNNLTGEIPSELGSIRELRLLDLSQNYLTGEIPPQLGELDNLHTLILRGNRFTGCIPAVLQSVEHNDLSTLRLPFCGN